MEKKQTKPKQSKTPYNLHRCCWPWGCDGYLSFPFFTPNSKSGRKAGENPRRNPGLLFVFFWKWGSSIAAISAEANKPCYLSQHQSSLRVAPGGLGRKWLELTAGTLWLVINWKIKQEGMLVFAAKPYASEGCCTSPLTWALKTQFCPMTTSPQCMSPWLPALGKQACWSFSGVSLRVSHYYLNHWSSTDETIGNENLKKMKNWRQT